MWGESKWGVYAFYDYDGEPIYVGQTNEKLSSRVRRHLTNQRTDAVAMRVLDVLEVAEIELWPLWEIPNKLKNGDLSKEEAGKLLDATEYSAYIKAINSSKFKAILNEKIPPKSNLISLPESLRVELVDNDTRVNQGHADIRISRRAETISRLADVIRERGEVSDGLRRVLVIQAIRLTYISAERLAYAEGRPQPDASTINSDELVGSVLAEHPEPPMEDEDLED
ncbi:GIY-YIG nuclease family protein [Nocardiopsis dassonvillei]|nr:GIY-YIG nuclease family protein [Nocardiopsis dassonvillei]NKY78178.1 GIY-YIG nuclease family protein [Nocardiopsis dassonvillei]